MESHLFRHAGDSFTLGGGGQSPTAGLGVGLLTSNATAPSQLAGPFAYTNGSVVLGPDVGIDLGGEAFIGNDSCGSTIVGSVTSIGGGAAVPFPLSFGGGVSNTWVWQWW